MTQSNASGAAPAPDALEIRDTRTGSAYSAAIRTEGPEGDTYIRAMDLRAVKRDPSEFGLLSWADLGAQGAALPEGVGQAGD